jgi:hypothetical protein
LTNFNQSKVKMYRRCQKQFAFRYDYAPEGQELVPKIGKVQLRRGSWLHALQEAHHRLWAGVEEGSDWEAVHEQLTEEYNKLFIEEREALGDLPAECERLFRGYLRFWGEVEDKYTVLQVGGYAAIEIGIEVPLERWGIVGSFKGTVDLVVEDHEYGGYWVWDAKWVKTIPAPDERMMSPQALMYVWGLRKQYDLDIRGFVYNYGRTKPPTIPRTLQKGVLSTAQKMDTDYATYLQAIKDLHGNRWKEYARAIYIDKLRDLKGRDALWFRRERIPTEPERVKRALVEFLISARQIENRNKPHNAPRSYFYNCRWGCEYHDICCAEFQGLDIEPLIRQNYIPRPERYTQDENEDLLSD